MLDFQVITCTVGLIGLFDHHAVADAAHGSPRGCGIVHAMMRTVVFEDGMQAAVGEGGADATVVQRRFQESLAKVLPFLIEEAQQAVLFKGHGADGVAHVHEVAEDHFSHAHGFAIDILAVIHHVEAIPFLDTKEVDRPGIDI